MRRTALAVALALVGAPAGACQLALLLALDVSSSVDAAEDRLQREGLAAALEDTAVRQAFVAGGPVALAAFEWSGKYQQYPVLPWILVGSAEDLDLAAGIVRASQRRQSVYPTAIGFALGHASRQLRQAPRCLAQTVDVSGDGINNDGFTPESAYANFPFGGVTVNGLVIGGDAQVLGYYETSVIRGPGAFVETADDYADFARAIRKKLLRELEPKAVGWLAE